MNEFHMIEDYTMCRKQLLEEISTTLNTLGFTESKNAAPFTFQRNVKYPSIFADKNDYAHFVVNTPTRSTQIVAKFQENNGTTIEKLAYTAMDAARTPHDQYLVVCAGSELLKSGRALDFLNERKNEAPKLHAISNADFEAHLNQQLKLESY